jgi:hypothetical protein
LLAQLRKPRPGTMGMEAAAARHKTSRLDNLAGVWALLGADHTNNNDKRKSAPALSSRGHRFELATKLRCRKNRK